MTNSEFAQQKHAVLIIALLLILTVAALMVMAHDAHYDKLSDILEKALVGQLIGALLLGLQTLSRSGSRIEDTGRNGRGSSEVHTEKRTTVDRTIPADPAKSDAPALTVQNADSIKVDGADIPPKPEYGP